MRRTTVSAATDASCAATPASRIVHSRWLLEPGRGHPHEESTASITHSVAEVSTSLLESHFCNATRMATPLLLPSSSS